MREASQHGLGGPHPNDQSPNRDPVATARLEAEILSRLHHPNVVRLKEFFVDGQAAYLVFEYLEGMSLEAFLRKLGKPPEEPMLRALLLPLAGAVAQLHTAGFLHRDLKPGNVQLRRDSQPILVDFGAALPRDGGPGRGQWSDLTPG